MYQTGTAHSLVHSCIAGETNAVHVCSQETLRTYLEVVSFILTIDATEEVIADTYADVNNYSQFSGMSETGFAQKPRNKALRCGNLFSDRRLKSIFVQNVLPAILLKVRNYLTSHPHIGLNGISRYAESYCDMHCATKRHSACTDSLPTHSRSTSSV